MNYGFIKVAAASPNVTVANPDRNSDEIIKAVRTAADLGVKLLVTPELGVTGYTCSDLFLQKRLYESSMSALRKIMNETAPFDIVTIVGVPIKVGSELYNCAAVIYHGELLGVVPKRNLPNYAEFYERRHFTPASDELREIELFGKVVPFGSRIVFYSINMPEFSFGCEICEDLWVAEPPSASLAASGAMIICNLSASDETIGKATYRRSLVIGQSARLVSGYIYADAGIGESTTDMVFAGHNLIAENGALLSESKPFESIFGDSCPMTVSEIDVTRLDSERVRMNTYKSADECLKIGFDMPVVHTALTRKFEPMPFVPSDATERGERCETILTIQSVGLARRLTHAHANKAVIGISGGLDSCLALLVSVKAMDILKRPRTDVIAITMPCFGTTSRTRSNAEILCERLGVGFRCIDIKKAVNVHFEDIGHDETNHNVVYENAQARERTQILMDIANAENGMVIGTGDLSELALGWATYNGDHMSMYAVNSGVPKTLVKHLIKFEAERLGGKAQKTLEVILSTEISPELLPPDKAGNIAQKTEDIVGPYVLHDFFLYYAVRWGFSPEKVRYVARKTFKDDFSEEVIDKWLKNFYKRFFSQQFKRSCIPDGVKVGTVTLSPRGDWRMPSDASVSLWLSEISD